MAQATQEFGEWPLTRLMTEVCGSGHKSADDLTRAQAMEAFERILADEPDHTTLGAFWLANRWKRNTPEELAAYTDVMCDRVEYAEPDCDPVDCGANYDGKGRSAILGVAAGAVAAAAGTPIVVHSGDRVPTQKQDAYKHVLDELGVATELTPRDSAAMVDATGFGFYYQPTFNPAIHDLYERRDMMGVRTFINTIETIANPAGASTHLGSFYHLPFAKKVTDTFAESEFHDVDRVLMFQGMEGYDDIRPGYTKVAEWDADGGDGNNGAGGGVGGGGVGGGGGGVGGGDGDRNPSFDDFEIETAAYGMDLEEDDLAVENVAVESAAITESVLAGERDGAFADAIALNAALRIYAGEDADSIEAGLETAREHIADGSAYAVLEAMRAF